MKLSHLSLISGSAVLAYTLYKKRDHITQFAQEGLKNLDEAKTDLDNIQNNLSIIQEQTQLLQKYGQDFQQKWRYFEKEKDAHISEINRILGHYQKTNS